MALDIHPVDPREPVVLALVAALDAYQASLYPAESNHLDPLEVLLRPEVRFLGATLDGALIGCGALKLTGDGAAELKRMIVSPAARGHGVGSALLAALEAAGRAEGVRVVRLETGVRQTEALALYRRRGYVERDAFAPYVPDPLSVFMEKLL